MHRARATLRPGSHHIESVATRLAAVLSELIPPGHILRKLELHGDALNESGRPKGRRYHLTVSYLRDPLASED